MFKTDFPHGSKKKNSRDPQDLHKTTVSCCCDLKSSATDFKLAKIIKILEQRIKEQDGGWLELPVGEDETDVTTSTLAYHEGLEALSPFPKDIEQFTHFFFDIFHLHNYLQYLSIF